MRVSQARSRGARLRDSEQRPRLQELRVRAGGALRGRGDRPAERRCDEQLAARQTVAHDACRERGERVERSEAIRHNQPVLRRRQAEIYVHQLEGGTRGGGRRRGLGAEADKARRQGTRPLVAHVQQSERG
eukprot:5289608-Pleurochrysis_carterae.AAC.4